MVEQISLPGFDPPPEPPAVEKPTDRIFFAVIPDTNAIKSIRQCTSQLQSQYGLSKRAIIDGRLHISLLGLGDYPGTPKWLVDAASLAADMLSVTAFDVRFDKVLTFGNQKADPSKSKPCVLVESADNQALADLQRSLIASLQKVRLIKSAPSSFTPHMTLLYDKQHVDATEVTPIIWKVKEFVLVRSQIGDVRRPYDILARWPLSSPAA